MDLPPDSTSPLPDVDPSRDGQDLSPPQPKPHSAETLRRELIEAFQGHDSQPGLASAGDALRQAIAHLSAVIDQLDDLYQAAESLEDKIKLSSALGVAAVRLSTLLRTQKFLSPNSRSAVDEALDQAIYEVNKEWGRI